MAKEIIIDAVDVSKCSNYNYDLYFECEKFFRRCDEFPNCYFKQLARAKDKIDYMEEYIKTVETARDNLKQEVEKWKHQAELGSDTTDKLSNQLEDKNQEIENLKKQNKMLSENNAVQQWCNMYNKKDKECFDALLKLAKKEQECEKLIKEKSEIKKYLGISDKTIIQRLEELQEFKDELKISEYNYQQALDDIKYACESECIEGTTGYVVDTYIILNIINDLEKEFNNGNRN